MKKLFLILFISIFLLSPLVSSWGPATHTRLANELFENPQSKIITDCLPYKDAFLMGSMTPDITVIYYYSSGGKNYQLTHNHNFADEVMAQARTDEERCFAYGIEAHLIADSVSHNMAVPKAIKKTFIPNWLVHPLLEQKYDAVMMRRYPGLENQSEHMMDALFGSNGDRYVEMVEKALGDNIDFDVKSDMTKLAYALGGFYEESYKPRGETFIFKIYPYVADLTVFLEPILGSINVGETEFYFDKAQELLENSYNNWGSRYQISPHGFGTLKEADRTATLFNFVWILLMFLPTGLFIFFKKRFRWRYLAFIPLMLLILILVIYAIV